MKIVINFRKSAGCSLSGLDVSDFGTMTGLVLGQAF
jgi:hypothetical protein